MDGKWRRHYVGKSETGKGLNGETGKGRRGDWETDLVMVMSDEPQKNAEVFHQHLAIITEVNV
jgi:hypothetical protein